MKKLLFLITLLVTANLNLAISQASRFDKEREARGYLNSPVTPINAKQLVKNKSRIGIGEEENLTFLSARQDKVGYTHTRYQQYYKGIEVEGATYVVHEKNDKVESANGGLIKNLNINTTPAINEAQALQIAANHADMTDAVVKLIIFDKRYTRNPDNYGLAYRITDKNQHTSVYVHAHTGEIITTINCMQHGDVPGTGVGAYYGLQDITVDDQGDVYVLKDNERDIQVFYTNNGSGDRYIEDSIITDINAHFDNAPHAVDAFWSLRQIYDYFSINHGLNSYSNDEPIRAWVNWDVENALWLDSDKIVLGNGNDSTRAHYTTMDMVAHEYMHGVIKYSTSNFQRGDLSEAGALSESYPDIFAAIIESAFLPNEDNWIIGERIVTESGKNGIRNLQNPYDPTMTRPMAAHYDEFGNNKYYNSGISSHAFYLMTNSIGIDNAAQIAYQALSYMSSNAQFIDARIAMVTAAEQLYGINSNAAQKTAAAWYAVGIGDDTGDNLCLPIIAECRLQDSLALIALYNSTDGANWNEGYTWDLAQPLDEWYGVTVNEYGCVICLDLEWHSDCSSTWIGGIGLSGTLPPEIGNLGSLKSLYLSGNDLGNIPPEIGNLTHLENLDMGASGLSGDIPPEIGNLSNLKHLDIYYNDITNIPSEIGNLAKLETLFLSFNPISGSLPPEIGNLTNLRSFTCNATQLSGSIPAEFGNLENLTRINLRSTYIDGCYYPNLASLCGQLDSLSIVSENNGLPSWEDFCNTGAGSCAPLTCAQTDSLALVAFYNSTNGADWTNPWDLNQPMSTWQGVSIVNGCVTQLILYGRGLSGTLPPEIDNLQSLSYLDLNGNDIGGEIPMEMGNMLSLTLLSMEGNEFIGSIPEEIGNLTELYHLNLGGGNLSGIIPREIGNLTKLTFLNLGGNPITGGIPVEIGNLIELKQLYLSNCELTDTIPKEIGNLINLNWLKIQLNNLSGNIPPEIENLQQLQYVDMSANNLTGSIPAGFGNIPNLISLVLSFNELTGGIPDEISGLHKLDDLNLSGNPLGGNIPAWIGYMPKLRLLWLNNCELTGSIPPELGNSPKLFYFFANDNHLSGDIPIELGNISTLGSIQLNFNQLTGSIPKELGNLANLSSLHLWGNYLTGSIPRELGLLTKLDDLFLSGNELSGELPIELAGLVDIHRLRLNGNNFSGDVPVEIALLPQIGEFWIHENKFTFKSLEPIKYLDVPSFLYANQDTIIPTISLGNQLSVDAGGTVAYNTYEWYRDGALATTIVGDSTYTPDIAGTYYCRISNAVITNPSEYHQNFTLRSADFDFAPSSLPVYPGDFNADGIVDNFDALYWGWAYGKIGIARDNTGVEWGPYVVDDWMYSVAGVNNKHQDGNGNGIINQDDLQAIIANYDSIRPIVSSNRMGLFSEDYILEFELIEETYTNDNKISRRYDVYLRHIDGEPVVIHGVAFDIEYTGFDEAPDIRVDTSNSSLGDSLGLVEVFNPLSKVFSVGISQQDQSPDTLTGRVAQLILDEIWQGGDEEPFTLFNGSRGIINIAEGENYPVAGQEVMVSPDNQGGDLNPTLAHAMVTQPTCNSSGRIEVQPVSDNSYTYAWSHDPSNNTNIATGLAPGVYDVIVTESGNQPATFEVVLGFSEGCLNDILLGVDVILEGTYQQDSTIVMKESLLNGTLIPKVNPYTGYHSAFSSVLEVGGENAPVDWLLLELRDINDWGTTIYEAPVLLQRNGRLVNAGGTYPVKLTPPNKIDSFYLVVKHRNHLPIMYAEMLGGAYNRVDFTKSDSYNANGTGTGQKEISDDIWVMIAGNADEDIYDVNGNDKIPWSEDNGSFGFYLIPDFNLDGDVNGKDKIFWGASNGTFSATPRPE